MGASAMLVTPCMLYPYLIELYSLRERKTKGTYEIVSAFFIVLTTSTPPTQNR